MGKKKKTFYDSCYRFGPPVRAVHKCIIHGARRAAHDKIRNELVLNVRCLPAPHRSSEGGAAGNRRGGDERPGGRGGHRARVIRRQSGVGRGGGIGRRVRAAVSRVSRLVQSVVHAVCAGPTPLRRACLAVLFFFRPFPPPPVEPHVRVTPFAVLPRTVRGNSPIPPQPSKPHPPPRPL